MPTRQSLQGFLRNWPAKILSLAAAVLLLVFHDITRLEERFLTVDVDLRLGEQLVPASTYPLQVRVRVRGESQDVFALTEADIAAVVDTRRYAEAGAYRVPVLLERLRLGDTDTRIEMTAEPELLNIILEERLVRSIEVQPDTTGFPARGYEMRQLVLTPSVVQVEGPRGIVERLGVVQTEELDLSSRRESFTERLRLRVPDPLVRFPGGDAIEVRGTVEEAVVLQTFEPVEVLVSGLDPALRLAGVPEAGLVRVQASQIDIEAVRPGDIQLAVDASGVDETGSLRLPVRPVVPGGFVVLRYEPSSIQLVVEGAP